MRPIRFTVSLAAWAILAVVIPGFGVAQAAAAASSAPAAQLTHPAAERTLVLALSLDRDGARLIGYSAKSRPFVPPRETASPRTYFEGEPVQIEVALIGPGGVRYTQRISVNGLCLAHGPDAPAEIAGDTIRLHRESVILEEPERAGFDRIEIAYESGGAMGLSRRVLGSATLDAAHFTSAGGKVRYDDLAFASASAKPQPGSALTPGTVHFPEEYGDPDLVALYGNAAETATRINIVIVPDGYPYAEKATMQEHAQALVAAFRARTPYLEHDRFINYILVYAYSNKNGTDQCDCAIVRDTAMSTRFAIANPTCGSLDNRCLYYGGGGCDTDSSANIAITELRAPAHDATIVMVNTPRYGGCGGERAVYAAANSNGAEIAIHEMGHSLAGLVDEYGGNTFCGTGGGVNASMNAVSGNWPEWIPELGAPSEGAMYYDRCVYRPASACEMRTLLTPFCPVCTQQWALTFFGHPRVNPTAPIESASPGSPVFTDQVTSQNFSIVTRFANAPGVTDDVTWQIQGPGFPTATTVATGTNDYTRVFGQPGTYTLTSRAVADTNFVKPAKYGANVDIASWTVKVCDTAAIPVASNNGPICSGATLQLTSATVPGGTYLWTGPGGFQSAAQSPEIVNAGPSASGTYTVTISTGACDYSWTTTAAVIGTGSACDDGNVCSEMDTCQNGICAGLDNACSDGNPCTIDGCSLPAGCTHGPVVCTPSDSCHRAGVCDVATGLCSNPGKDADTDGHVDGLCGGDDCNDANAQVWFAPIEVTHLRLAGPVSTSLTWDDQRASVGPGTTFGLVSGTINHGTTFHYNPTFCLTSTSATTFIDARGAPSAGSYYWYLVQAENACGLGTLGTATADANVLSCF